MNRFTTSKPYRRPETICEICEHQFRFHIGADDRCPSNSAVAAQVMLPGRAAAVAAEKAQCCMCGKKDLSTVEDGGPECELHDGRWVCSSDCWEKASALVGAVSAGVTVKPLDVEALIVRAAKDAREVFAGSCDHTHEAIGYMEQVFLAALSQPPQRLRVAAEKAQERGFVRADLTDEQKAELVATMVRLGQPEEHAKAVVDQLVQRPLRASEFHTAIEREKPTYVFDLKTPNRSTKLRAKMRLKAVMDEFGVVRVHGPIHDRGDAVFLIEMKSGNKYERRNKWGTV